MACNTVASNGVNASTTNTTNTTNADRSSNGQCGSNDTSHHQERESAPKPPPPVAAQTKAYAVANATTTSTSTLLTMAEPWSSASSNQCVRDSRNLDGEGGEHQTIPTQIYQLGDESDRSALYLLSDGACESECGPASAAAEMSDQRLRSEESDDDDSNDGEEPVIEDIQPGILTTMWEQEKMYYQLTYPANWAEQMYITRDARAILFDWMMEIANEVLLSRETLQLSLHYVDRYLARKPHVNVNIFQSLGVAALFIASKLEEIAPPPAKFFAISTGSQIDVPQLFQIEIDMLQVLEGIITPVTSFCWVGIYMQVCRVLDFR